MQGKKRKEEEEEKKKKKQKHYGPNRGRRSGKNTQKNYTEKVLMIWITIMGWSHTYSQISWNVWSLT